MLKKIASSVVCTIAAVLAFAHIPANAAPPDCGVWRIGVGGFHAFPGFWQKSTYLRANQLLVYDTLNPAFGVKVLGDAISARQRACSGQKVVVVGHSMGAAISHAWVSTHPNAKNVSVVLLADPKRVGNPGGMGSWPATHLLGWPIAGTDRNYGNVPVYTVCNWDDKVCNAAAPFPNPWTLDPHHRYDFNTFNYPYGLRGDVYR